MSLTVNITRVTWIVLDSVGIGELPDAPAFGDAGAHTLGHIAETVPGFDLPELRRLGLANIAPIVGWAPHPSPEAAYGKMAETSAGKDTMTGHWELAGLHIPVPFRTFPDGFPEELIREFERRTGRPVIGNKPASGTAIIEELGEEQMRTGAWIVYTSADSVFQIAAHEEIIPLDELYRACEIARELTLREPYAVGRVIARPYVGKPGAFTRTPNRHDYAVKPPQPTVLNALKDAGYDVWAVGKINDIFSGEGITAAWPTMSNDDGVARTLELMEKPMRGVVFTNLVDFDSLYGHRRDPQGYARALETFDRAVPELKARTGDDALLVITADHGNDPIHHGTDHTREYVPLIIYNPRLGGRPLGTRPTFADLAATIAELFGVTRPPHGTSLLADLGLA